jgi:transposase
MTYPIKLRQKIFAIKAKRGLTYEETAEYFEISARTLLRWSKRLEPCVKHKYHKSKIDKEALKEDVKNHPDAYHYERAKRLGVSTSCVRYNLQKLKISYKKKPKPP